MLYYIMNSLIETADKEMVSIFRNTPDIPSIHGGIHRGIHGGGIISTRLSPLSPLFIAIMIVGVIGHILYTYQEKTRHFIGSWLLYFHMGKNNEIYTTRIPENNHFRSVLSTIDFSEELRPF